MTSLSQSIPCLICHSPLEMRLARGRKSGKPFIMLLCVQDGRHFRGFINHQPYVKEVLARLESHKGQTTAPKGEDGVIDGSAVSRRSRTNLERSTQP